ncbi:MAG: ABC transporter ATP-binding protein [Planctomycetaceae bacterium]|jgi:lipoprotein-releasing system ATP-binding protein|nr:ABC transporter ATP-binding protein [Planctomycetaceae bacterium]
MKSRQRVDFRPVKPSLDPPEPPPKPNIRLSGVLRAPDGRTLLDPPTIDLNELFEQPLPLFTASPKMIPSSFKESVTNSDRSVVPVRESSFRVPFLFENLPAIENAKNLFDKKSFGRKNEPIERFHSTIDRTIDRMDESRQTTHLPEIPPLPNWERNFDDPPATTTKSSHSSTKTNLEEFQLNEHFEDIDVFLTRNKMKQQPDRNSNFVQEEYIEQKKNTEQNQDSEQKRNCEQKKIILPVIHTVRGNRETVFRRKHSVSVLKKRETLVVPSEKSVTELLRAENLTKSYYRKKLKIPVLKGVNLSVQTGEFVAIIGQSGSGKSTLLHLLGTLDNPESGSVYFEDQRIDNLPVVRRDYLRNRSIGFIFQFYYLLPELTTLENVLSPLMIREGILSYFFRRGLYIEKAKALLEKMGLSHRLKHKPCELSGGEIQRAAIARALISEPKILLADEPTGNLDAASAAEIMELLQHLNKEQKLTIIMVTHDNAIANTADRIVRMVDGVIV